MEGTARTLAPERAWVEYGTTLVSVRAETVSALLAPRVEEPAPSDVVVVRASSDGALWLHPEPGAEPFVTEGRFVGPRDTLALVEVMKTFSPVRSPGAGVVQRVIVEDGASVERGQPLFWIRVARRSAVAS
jgi:biotin carboxyl carrier protein